MRYLSSHKAPTVALTVHARLGCHFLQGVHSALREIGAGICKLVTDIKKLFERTPFALESAHQSRHHARCPIFTHTFFAVNILDQSAVLYGERYPVAVAVSVCHLALVLDPLHLALQILVRSQLCRQQLMP